MGHHRSEHRDEDNGALGGGLGLDLIHFVVIKTVPLLSE